MALYRQATKNDLPTKEADAHILSSHDCTTAKKIGITLPSLIKYVAATGDEIVENTVEAFHVWQKNRVC